MTYLQLVNSVLRRLRETEVSSVSETAYSKLIGDFINDTKIEVENAWPWIQLRQTVQITTVADTIRYTMTGTNQGFKILQVINDTTDHELKLAPYGYMNKMLTGNSASLGEPMYYDINDAVNGVPNIDFYPEPDGAYTINVNMVNPQGVMTADSDEMFVPSQPVILGAYTKAISERGEDGGMQYGEALSMYQQSLSDYIQAESRHLPHETIWGVV